MFCTPACPRPAPCAARPGSSAQRRRNRRSAAESVTDRIGGRRTFGGGAVYIPYPIYGGYGMGYGFDGFYASDYPGTGATIRVRDMTGRTLPTRRPAGPAHRHHQPEFPDRQRSSAVPRLLERAVARAGRGGGSASGRSARATPGALADDQPTIFLIAMQDHTIRPVIAYWVQGDTLHYVSREGVLEPGEPGAGGSRFLQAAQRRTQRAVRSSRRALRRVNIL